MATSTDTARIVQLTLRPGVIDLGWGHPDPGLLPTGAIGEAVPADEDGLRVDALAATIAELRRAGRPPRLLYTVPTFHNPTGASLAPDRRRALVELAAAEGLLVVEDDAYRELAYDGPAPPSLWSL